MAHTQVQQVLSHFFQYKYHYPEVKIQPPGLRDLNPYSWMINVSRQENAWGEVSMLDVRVCVYTWPFINMTNGFPRAKNES